MGELKEYKDYLKKYHNRKKNQKIDKYHSDWYYGIPKEDKEGGKSKKKKVTQNTKQHRKNKDNPNKAFIYDSGTGKWIWVSVDSPEKNYRYVAARHNSTVYLRKVLKFIK